MQKMDGMNYAPVAALKLDPVVEPGEFTISVIGLQHGHIYAMCNGLLEAGATLKWVYDEDEELLKKFQSTYPQVGRAETKEQILEDQEIQLVASAAIPNLRTSLGVEVLKHGKHYFADKPGMTTFQQLEEAKQAVKTYGKKFYIYYGERVHVESAVFTQRLIDEGKLGRVIHVDILAPHRLNKDTRPEWFFDSVQSGSILNDIGSHQYEQFLSYTGAKTARVQASKEGNYANKDHQKFRDFGDVMLIGDNGATGYLRVDWFTPDGLRAWGDGRVFIVGEKGTVEIRKYIDIGATDDSDLVFFTDGKDEHRYNVYGKVGFPFFGEFIKDCMNGTEYSMTQEHVFESMRIALEAAEKALQIV